MSPSGCNLQQVCECIEQALTSLQFCNIAGDTDSLVITEWIGRYSIL